MYVMIVLESLFIIPLNHVPLNLIRRHFQLKATSVTAVNSRLLWLISIVHYAEFSILYISVNFYIKVCAKPLI